MSLRRVAGWPLRRALDPRVQWTVAELDARLGSGGGARPPVHQRLDEIEAALAALTARVESLAAQIALDRAATDEGLSAVLDGLRELHARADAGDV
jgi:hypothetical protein